MTRKFVVSLCSVLAAVFLPSCTPVPVASPAGETRLAQGAPTDLRAEYAAMAQAEGKVFTLDPDKSVVRIYVFRGGRAARLGHNHVVSAPHFVGFYFLPASGASGGRFDLEFRLDQLAIDDSAATSGPDSAFTPKLSTAELAGVRKHMLGPDNLQADEYPLVRVHSVRIVGEAPKFAADVQVAMHGQVRELWVPLTVEGLPDHLTVTGSFVLRQTDFGVKPYAVLGGLLAVQDEVVIEFKLVGA